MALGANEIIIPDGTPSSGTQKMKSAPKMKYIESGQDVSLELISGGASANYILKNSSGVEKGSLVYDEGTENIIIQSITGNIDFTIPAAKFFSFLGAGPDTDKVLRFHAVGTNGGQAEL